jgi:hypothetical protein
MRALLTSTGRRASIRVLISIPVKVRIKRLSNNIPMSFQAETADLSSRGVSLFYN